ncbi:hypothetical protein NLU13_5239 [Sarocladium strictum]|uniref:Zinc ribbon domain-containing protein n=1 Tax=Sarocladium strictum TaxID=5046 RepID=A0AA39L713_SARSR|nr:hypothetical protein NLU13_5239 [Sarocladium strictum]
MGHSSCPKCTATIAGGSKTCGSCGAVHLPQLSRSAKAADSSMMMMMMMLMNR